MLRAKYNHAERNVRQDVVCTVCNHELMLLADEPTGALDSRTAREILALFHDLHHAGMTVVLVTHDPRVAAEAPRVITVADGTIGSDDRARPSGHYAITTTGLGAVS